MRGRANTHLFVQIFIDRDPSLFATILNFLRTKELYPRSISVHMLMHEAEFYGITPLGESQSVWRQDVPRCWVAVKAPRGVLQLM